MNSGNVMNFKLLCLLSVLSLCLINTYAISYVSESNFIPASDSKINYTGRIDKSNGGEFKFSSPGVYITARFIGTSCEFDMAAEGSQNYIEIIVDNNIPQRILVESTRKTYLAANGLANGEHTILICKDTESGMGSLFFYGFRCDQLVELPLPTRKIECYGN